MVVCSFERPASGFPVVRTAHGGRVTFEGLPAGVFGQREAGDELFAKARRMRDKQQREEVYREIMAKCYATRWYEAVRPWMQ